MIRIGRYPVGRRERKNWGSLELKAERLSGGDGDLSCGAREVLDGTNGNNNHLFARRRWGIRQLIQPAFGRIDIGEITDPFAIGVRGGKVLVQPVRCRHNARLALGGCRMPLLLRLRHNPMQAHQTRYPVLATHHALAPQDDPDARTAVGFSAGDMFRADLCYQNFVGLCESAGLALAPGVIPAALHFQYPAHPLDVEFRLMFSDEGVLHVHFWEKMLTTFLRSLVLR